MFDKNIKNVLFINLFFACVRASGFQGFYLDATLPICASSRIRRIATPCIIGNNQDISTPRANTLSDDADDIQRQLDNEARDRLKLGKSKTIWVFHFPTQFPTISMNMNRPHSADLMRRAVTDVSKESILPPDSIVSWDYKDQNEWGSEYPDCGGRSQSPVDLPYAGFLKVTGARRILFLNHDTVPQSLSLINDGNNVKLSGTWQSTKRPTIHGGAAYSRRYVFDSLLLHWPSEHTISGLQYPIESQAFYVSAEYTSVAEALRVTNDKMALLGVANLYKFSNRTHKGLKALLHATLKNRFGSTPVLHHPLSFFNPPMKEYACYQGSLPTPPCTESVLWLVRARSLPVTREFVEQIQNTLINGESQFLFRQTQPMNDRKVYLIN